MAEPPTTKLVRCPEPFTPLFAEAERIMEGFFAKTERHPERGEIQISGVRYLLMRAESFSMELHEELRKTFGDAGARQIRYKIAKALGARDAKMFHELLKVTDPNMKLALGPIHFAHVGWAFVDIFPESTPSPDESYFLVYDHPYSFEAAAYLDNGQRADSTVCFMSAGYSTGWCEVSYGLDLKAEEITCRAAGHDKCVFVMSHPKHLEAHVRDYRKRLGVK
jgi:predicted hydrocarbon binding protein